MSYVEDKLLYIPPKIATKAVLDRLKMVDRRWKCLTPDKLTQTCPTYKYVYETTERNLRRRRKNIEALEPSPKPTPRPDALEHLLRNYTSS